MRKLLVRALCLSAALTLLSCSDSNPVVGDSKPSGDRPSGDQGILGDGPKGGEAKKTDTRLPPDGPKPPAQWKLVSGPGPVVRDAVAVLLNDGRVLVTGGFRYPSPTQTVPQYQKGAWLYQPDTNSYVQAGDMAQARTGHTASLLPDGRVLIAGGEDSSNEHDTTEIFDPGKPAASAWSAGPSMPSKRFSHAAVTLADGRIVIAGGASYPDILGSILIYKPATSSFQALGISLGTPRAGMAAALLKTGKLLLAGGDDGSSAFSKVIETFDPATGTVATLTVAMNDKKSWPFGFTLPSGKVFITAGYAFAYPPRDDLYDPTTNTVAAVTHPGGSARGSAAVLLADGRVLVTGGFEGAQQKKARAFDEKGMAWDMLPDLLRARSYHEMVTLKDGSVLAIAGMEGAAYTFPTESERLYNP